MITNEFPPCAGIESMTMIAHSLGAFFESADNMELRKALISAAVNLSRQHKPLRKTIYVPPIETM